MTSDQRPQQFLSALKAQRDFVPRDASRPKQDDWKLNVLPKLSVLTESVEVYEEQVLVGWKIQNRYE